MHAGDKIGEIALATEMGEGIGMEAEVVRGNCTNLLPARK